VNYKILLADESVTVQKIITLTFSDEGVDVLAVNDGNEAIHRLQYMRPALIMADVSIPGKNGYEICEFVKNHPDMKTTPVILLVPAFEPFDEERARRIGADYHLTKPFQSIRTLISTVKNLIEPDVSAPPLPLPQAETPPSAQTIGKSAKIEELIRQAAVSNRLADDWKDEDPLAEVDLGFAQTATLAVAPIPDDPFGFDPAPAIVTKPDPVTMSNESITEQAGVVADEFDDILELDDVLPEPPERSVPVAPVTEVAKAAETEFVAANESASTLVIPQQVIDEIVDRVVAELMEKLNHVFARRIAAELVQAINRPHPPQPLVVRKVTDNLLEID